MTMDENAIEQLSKRLVECVWHYSDSADGIVSVDRVRAEAEVASELRSVLAEAGSARECALMTEPVLARDWNEGPEAPAPDPEPFYGAVHSQEHLESLSAKREQPDLSPEQVAAELRRRKWRGRDDWEAADQWFVCTRVHSSLPAYGLEMIEARALAAGLRAQDELAIMRAENEKMKRQLDCLCDICGEDMGQDAACMRCYYTQRGLLPGGPYDDTQPVLAALETLVGDQRATDAQRRTADRAAAEIKILQKQLAQSPAPQPDLDAIEAELQPFATIADKYEPRPDSAWGDGYVVAGNPDTFCITVGQLRAIRTLLAELRRLRAGPAVGLVDGVKVIGSVNKNGTDLLVVLCSHCECPRFADYSCDTCAKREPPTAGSWPWALEQLKAGKPVKRQRWPEGSSLVLHPYELEAGRFLILLNVLGRHPWQSVVEDFEATDWQLAPTESE